MSGLLEFREVDAGYGPARILHRVTLKVEKGERVAVLGRNGVGKTTVVNTFLGIASKQAGEVIMGSRPHRTVKYHNAARAGIAVVPQGRRIIRNLTVKENLVLGASVRRPGPWNVDAVGKLFPILRERADSPGMALSGGQQQMLAIGRALMANPDLLVLDEPSEGLAPVIVDELSVVLKRLADAGTGLLLIEQNISLIQRVATRYYVLSKGAVIEQSALAGVSLETLKAHVTV